MNIVSLGEDLYFNQVEAGLTALSNADYPASGSFVDVSDFERFAFLIELDVLADALTFKVQQATAANGTPKDITNATITMADDDDGDTILLEVETRHLDINNDYHFVTLDVTGNSGTNNASITFIGVPFSKPVTQPATFNHTIVAG